MKSEIESLIDHSSQSETEVEMRNSTEKSFEKRSGRLSLTLSKKDSQMSDKSQNQRKTLGNT